MTQFLSCTQLKLRGPRGTLAVGCVAALKSHRAWMPCLQPKMSHRFRDFGLTVGNKAPHAGEETNTRGFKKLALVNILLDTWGKA